MDLHSNFIFIFSFRCHLSQAIVDEAKVSTVGLFLFFSPFASSLGSRGRRLNSHTASGGALRQDAFQRAVIEVMGGSPGKVDMGDVAPTMQDYMWHKVS